MVGNNEGRRKEIMSRIRSIKPEFFFDEELAHLTAHVRLFFIGLWLQADREGRLEDRPSFLKANIFPYEDIDAEKLLDVLAPKFIVRYEVAGKRYIQIRNFLKHQLPHYKEVASIIPPPSENPTLTQHQSDVDLTLIQPCTQEGSRKGAGREGKGIMHRAAGEAGARCHTQRDRDAFSNRWPSAGVQRMGLERGQSPGISSILPGCGHRDRPYAGATMVHR